MALYFYTAVSHQRGEKISGNENAESEHALAALLRDKGYILTSAEIQGGSAKQKKSSFLSFNFSRVSLTEKLLFVRNLKVMVSAGVALPKALDVLSQQVHSKMLQKTL
ncbi:MAG: hypothetical protein HYV77_04045, partial [Candidatus Wildermuthbacteria bacterium]|nr:hypothetical protein [Candidatus Wildermuthbacteria bacterium]